MRMKKLFSLLLLAGAFFGFTACDSDPVEGEPRTEFQFTMTMNDEAKNVLKFNWMSAGWSTSMTIIKWEIENAKDLPNSGNFVGKVPTMMNVSISCSLRDKDKLEDKTYQPVAYLMCKVTTKDENGTVLKTKNIVGGDPITNAKKYSKSELISTFGDEKNSYSMNLGVDVKDGGIIKITEESENPGKYGSEPKG